MYVPLFTVGTLFSATATIFLAVSGVFLFFSRNIREGIARLRRRLREGEDEVKQ
jgi:hypothetical protein